MSYIDKERLITGIANDRPQDILGYIATFPSIKSVQPKASEWIPVERDFQGNSLKFICAECGQLVSFQEPVKICPHKFCLGCGCKMRNPKARNETVFHTNNQ